MGFLEWATSPWGQRVPIHIAWFLIWVAAIAGLLFPHRSRHLRPLFRQTRRNLPAAYPLASPRAFRSVFPGTRSPRAYFTGLWRPRCSRCSSQLSFRK